MIATTRVRLTNMMHLRELATIEMPRDLRIATIAISPDGAQLAVGIADRLDLLMLWDLRRIRAQLAVMELDWELPPWPPAREEAGGVIDLCVDLGPLAGLANEP